MYQAYKMLKTLSNRLLSCPLSFQKFSLVAENHGKEFYYMVLQEQVKRFWQKHVQLKPKEHFFRFLHLI